MLPYSPAFTSIPLYTKPPIFKKGQVVSDISAAGNYSGTTTCLALWNLVSIKNTSESATEPVSSGVLVDVMSACCDMQNHRNLIIQTKIIDQKAHIWTISVNFSHMVLIENIRIWGFSHYSIPVNVGEYSQVGYLQHAVLYETYSFFVIIFFW